jgi:hypothetical protein
MLPYHCIIQSIQSLLQGVRIMEQNENSSTKSNAATLLKCPECNSVNIEEIHNGKQIGRTIGTLAGGAAGVTGVFSGAEVGAGIGAIGGPAGIAIGGVMGALFGGLIGAAAGRTIGENIGEVADDHLLENMHCLNCDHTFRE